MSQWLLQHGAVDDKQEILAVHATQVAIACTIRFQNESSSKGEKEKDSSVLKTPPGLYLEKPSCKFSRAFFLLSNELLAANSRE